MDVLSLRSESGLEVAKPCPGTFGTPEVAAPARPMRVLLLYPEVPQTFWGLTHALRFFGKRVFSPPLGLLTVAAMLPRGVERRLVDLNTAQVKDELIQWADYVFISAMAVQDESARALINRCKRLGAKIVAGGPLFTCCPDEFPEVDHLVLNEAEITFPEFLQDLARGCPRQRYSSEQHADMRTSPLPAYELLDVKAYAMLTLQFSRGCPNQCDFCNVTSLFGHRPRIKTTAQILAELDQLYKLGWKGKIFFVDDNLLCNKRYLKDELLPAIIRWQNGKNGISFHTQVSMNLADDQELVERMYAAGFDWVFIGIETPEEASLSECGKQQNLHRNMPEQVARLQYSGLQVLGGFIIGFDHDPPDIFRRQFEFIQNGGIAMAMVGLLQAPPGTKLYERLEKENRLVTTSFTPDSVVCDMNFVPRMDREMLLAEYKNLVRKLYSPDCYYRRVAILLSRLKPPSQKMPLSWDSAKAVVRCLFWLGFIRNGRGSFWKTFFWSCLFKPECVQAFFLLAIFGYHFARVYEDMITSASRASARAAV